MLEGVNKILTVTTDSQKVAVIGQIDAANKRLRAFKLELEKLNDTSSGTAPMQDQDAEEKNLIRELEAQLEDESKKREALNKLAIGDKKKAKHSEQNKDLEVEILVSDRLISKTKASLDVLRSVSKLN